MHVYKTFFYHPWGKQSTENKRNSRELKIQLTCKLFFNIILNLCAYKRFHELHMPHQFLTIYYNLKFDTCIFNNLLITKTLPHQGLTHSDAHAVIPAQVRQLPRLPASSPWHWRQTRCSHGQFLVSHFFSKKELRNTNVCTLIICIVTRSKFFLTKSFFLQILKRNFSLKSKKKTFSKLEFLEFLSVSLIQARKWSLSHIVLV